MSTLIKHKSAIFNGISFKRNTDVNFNNNPTYKIGTVLDKTIVKGTSAILTRRDSVSGGELTLDEEPIDGLDETTLTAFFGWIDPTTGEQQYGMGPINNKNGLVCNNFEMLTNLKYPLPPVGTRMIASKGVPYASFFDMETTAILAKMSGEGCGIFAYDEEGVLDGGSFRVGENLIFDYINKNKDFVLLDALDYQRKNLGVEINQTGNGDADSIYLGNISDSPRDIRILIIPILNQDIT